MPTLNYAPIIAAVTGALELAGTTATLRQRVQSGGTEDAPTYTDTDTTVKVVDDQEKSYDSETGVTRTRRVLYMAAEGPEPKQGDKVIFGGKTHTLYEVKPTSPGGVDIIYACYLEV